MSSNKPSAAVLTSFNTNPTGFGGLFYNQFGGAGSLSSSINGYGAYNDATGSAGIACFNVTELGPSSASTLFAQSNGSNSVLTVQNNSLTGSANPVSRVQNNSTRTSFYTLNSNASPSALALDVDGHGLVRKNLNVLLVLTAGTKPFKIDHPLDPENKYLYHTAVESPDMMNVYNGNVVTDGGGYATVSLPEWFEALNRDFRYQLTVIGQFAQAIVAEEVRNNAFVIRTDRPNVKVSWQVTGIRQDAFANRYRVPVEEEKAAEDRGRYLHPAAFGAPDELGIGYEARQAAAAAEAAPPPLPEVEEITLPDGTVIRAPQPAEVGQH
jgi:hypothetical protein